MNKIFDIKRFGFLLKRNLYTSRMFFLQSAGILVAIYLIYIIVGPIMDQFMLSTIFLPLLFFAAISIIILSPAMEEKRDKGKAIFNFILPVSTFEKFTYLILKYVIMIPVMYIIIFSILRWTSEFFIPDDKMTFALKNLDFNDFKHLYQMIAAQSVVLLVYLYTKKYTLIKAIFVLIAIIIAMITISGLTMYATGLQGMNFSGSYFHNIPETTFIDILKKLIVPCGIWVTAYFKLRETEI